ncbi:thiamine diphosphokinase [Terrilactibacillus sp. BCM23-1]|uniref:Thiamine diphosphokinase n=1 Tax=Terrilactibacillus tamarindi TaxID=2599694 RepID=A0A6N8CTL4_9BACI|nr:thiamine diphosphokinase [Terrilactibacillus tamarindi]MTT32315.1 thiamine diphosphokinase [Terrilactibacillus tamarindi]
MTKYAILAGGPPHLHPSFDRLKNETLQWIGVDRGTYTLLKKGITPVKSFGDFDSITTKEKEWIFNKGINIDLFPPEKDKTDLELAIDWVIEQNSSACIVLGATGGRLDHELLNIQLLYKLGEHPIEACLLDRYNRISLLKPNVHSISRESSFQYVSFIPLTMEVKDLTLKGFKYELNHATIRVGSSRCISNEYKDPVGEVRFTEGCLLMIQSKDSI